MLDMPAEWLDHLIQVICTLPIWPGESFWTYQIPTLSAKNRVITIDLPGHGQSEPPSSGYTQDGFARAVDAVLQANKIRRNRQLTSAAIHKHRQTHRKWPTVIS